MDLPKSVKKSGLFQKLSEDAELKEALLSLRENVIPLAAATIRIVPGFTDHTIAHMDKLWSVADEIITEAEMEEVQPAEAFLIGSGFYLHDIGMAYAATEEGLNRIRQSDPYKSTLLSLASSDVPTDDREALAIADAVRHLHAAAALELATTEIPGTGRYLFEAQDFRNAWGTICGQIASSHHWTVEAVGSAFGPRGIVPLPGGRKGDLAYSAAILRITDYAHINRDRARAIEREYRPPLSSTSLMHWRAQESIDGPTREHGGDLKFNSAQPIENVDAWWLFYEMVNGLDREIQQVSRMLYHRPWSQWRFSLKGVRDAGTPAALAKSIAPKGFLPVEIDIRTGSTNRLIELLGGEALYGPDPMAAVRELIQNACDAVLLQQNVACDEAERALASLPISVSLQTMGEHPTLIIEDHGNGMSETVIRNYLISLASNYWQSRFLIDYPDLAQRGFKSAGRFGIGFLSAFMIGDEVAVDTRRKGSGHYSLVLHGIGRRGELRVPETINGGGSGTKITIKLKPSVVDKLQPLVELVKTYVPALPHTLRITVDERSVELPPKWFRAMSAMEFERWVQDAAATLRRFNPRNAVVGSEVSRRSLADRRWMEGRSGEDQVWPSNWPEYVTDDHRLVASAVDLSILCSRGIALQPVYTPGFVGVIDLDSAVPDVSRNRFISADISSVLEVARTEIAPQVAKNLDALTAGGLVINKFPFIARCASVYGRAVLRVSKIAWIAELRMPGDTRLINCGDLEQLARGAGSIYITIGSGPWNALRRWEASKPPPNLKEVAILVDDADIMSMKYVRFDEAQNGQLKLLWPNWEDHPLFATVTEVIGNSWGLASEELATQPGWTRSSGELHGRFVRPAEGQSRFTS